MFAHSLLGVVVLLSNPKVVNNTNFIERCIRSIFDDCISLLNVFRNLISKRYPNLIESYVYGLSTSSIRKTTVLVMKVETHFYDFAESPITCLFFDFQSLDKVEELRANIELP